MVPPKLHFMWMQGLHKAPDNFRSNLELWRQLNPDHHIFFWDSDSIEALLRRDYPEWRDYYFALKGSTPMAGLIKQCDMARLLTVHRFGGVYLDMDLEPQSPMKDFWDDPFVYNRHLRNTPELPEQPSADRIDKTKFKILLSREHGNIDVIGKGIANGVLISDKGEPFWMDFLINQKEAHRGKVLDFVGTWALTRYIRSRVGQLTGRLFTMPPHYFLWEKRYFKCPPPGYTISTHLSENSWGDKTLKEWWHA